MRKWMLCLFPFLLLFTAACGRAPAAPGSPQSRPLANAQSSLFNTLEVQDGKDAITADFDVYLAETEAAFLWVEATEKMEVTLRYTYDTGGGEGAALGYRPAGGEAAAAFPLPAATEDAFNAVWNEAPITLQAGTTVFYLTGDQVTCNMRFQLNGADAGHISYAGAFPREKALETLAPVTE